MTLLPPNADQQRRIDEQLPPEPEMRRRDILAIRDWLKKQPHLPKHMDDVRLEHFLFGCKNSLERCKKILETYFSARTALPEFFANRDSLGQDVRDSCDVVDYFVLPKLTAEGYRVSVLRLKDTRLDRFSLQAITRRVLMVMDVRLLEDKSLSNIMIFDLKGFSAGHFAKCSPTQAIVRKAMLATQNSMPFRLERIYYLHAPNFISSVISVFYPLLKEKLIQKFRIFNGGGEELHDDLGKDILPNEWGGTAGTFKELSDSWQAKVESHRDWFLREEKLSRTNESARLPSSKSTLAKELEGLQGSFRRLEID